MDKSTIKRSVRWKKTKCKKDYGEKINHDKTWTNKEKPGKGSLKQLTLPQYANKGAYKTTKREKENNNKHTHTSKATVLLLLYRLILKDISGRSFYCIRENFHCIAGETIRQKDIRLLSFSSLYLIYKLLIN